MDIMELALLRSDSSTLIDNINSITGKNDTNLNNAISELTQQLQDALDREDALISNTPMNEYYNDRVTSMGVTGQQGTNFQCTQIKKITLPSMEHCPAQYAFTGRSVSLLEELYVPKLIDSGYGFAEGNPNLKTIDFGFSFGGAKCRNCPNLDTIIIRNSSVASVGNAHLTGTKLASDGVGGYVYVPQNLVTQYEANDTWQTYANVLAFRKIEGSIYELNE